MPQAEQHSLDAEHERGLEFVLEVYSDMRSALGGRIKTRDEKRREKAAKNRSTSPFGTGRDPRSLRSVLQKLASDRGWEKVFAENSVLSNWQSIVGANIAAHSTVIALDSGVLTVQVDKQVWTTELRRLRPQLLEKINRLYPAAQIVELHIVAPQTVNWRRGKYTVSGGRGPRDTYD